ncbi:MAG: hypothetical protein OXD44_09555 [Gammaproteobacteria bacterium]|nr:hypothetical protein [Gammaproteobacteria bacterium]
MNTSESRNRTLTCAEKEYRDLAGSILRIEGSASLRQIKERLIAGDFLDIASRLPRQFVDLPVLDSPCNLTRDYHGNRFRELDKPGYALWFGKAVDLLAPMLKPRSTIYACPDWKTPSLVLPAPIPLAMQNTFRPLSWQAIVNLLAAHLLRQVRYVLAV